MILRKDLATIISDRFTQRGGKRIPKYLADWFIEYFFEALKIALSEDGYVKIRNYIVLERVESPEHIKKMPNGDIVTVPSRTRIRVRFNDKYVKDIENGIYKESIDRGNDSFK